MREWPEEIVIRIVSSSTGEGLGNTMVLVRLLASKKNDYPLGPFISNHRGEILIRRGVLLKTIERCQREFPSDYADSLDDCRGRLLVEVESSESILERGHRLGKFYPRRARKLLDLLSRATNATIVSAAKEFNVHESEPPYTIMVTQKEHPPKME